MAAVEGVRGGGVEVVAVGDERVVAPVGPQLALGACEAAAAYDQAQLGGLGVGAAERVAAAAGLDGGLSDLGLAAAGVRDRLPGVVGALDSTVVMVYVNRTVRHRQARLATRAPTAAIWPNDASHV